MKFAVATLFVYVIFSVHHQVAAQETPPEYVLSGDIKVSVFGGPMLEFSSVDQSFAVSVGGGGGLILNKQFFLGGYGMGYTGDLRKDVGVYNLRLPLDFGHGGIWTGYSFAPDKVVHVMISSRFGWGSARWDAGDIQVTDPNDPIILDIKRKDNLFVIAPEIGAEINIARFVRVALAGGYRFVTGLELTGLNGDAMNGLAGTITLKFGGF